MRFNVKKWQKIAILAISCAFLGLVACGQTISREVVGPVSLAVATVPNTIEAGDVVLHVQISSADGQRPVGDAHIQAQERRGAQFFDVPVIPVATPGASEVRVKVPEGGQGEVRIEIMGGGGSLGSLKYRLIPGQKGAQLVK